MTHENNVDVSLPDEGSTWADANIELQIGKLLRLGVLLSAFVVAIGGVMFLAHHGQQLPQDAKFQGQPIELCSVWLITSGALHGSPRAIIQLGMLQLISTPVARVAFAAYAFARQGDQLYVIISLLVLAILIVSMLGMVS